MTVSGNLYSIAIIPGNDNMKICQCSKQRINHDFFLVTRFKTRKTSVGIYYSRKKIKTIPVLRYSKK